MSGLGVLSIPCSTGERILLNLDRLSGTLVDRFAALGLNRKSIRAVYEYGYRRAGPDGVTHAVLMGKAFREHFDRILEAFGGNRRRVGLLRGIFVRVRNGHIVDFGRQRGRCEVAATMRYVDGTAMTDHAIEQANRRHITMEQIDAALSHGELVHECGAHRHILTRKAIGDARARFGIDLSPFAGTVVIMAPPTSLKSTTEGALVERAGENRGTDWVVVTVYCNRKFSGSKRFRPRPNRNDNNRRFADRRWGQ